MVTVKGGAFSGLRFATDTPLAKARAESLFTKEPGTVAWLKEACRAGDVVFDVGANIGLYAVLAARLVGDTGKVLAFEPHVGNAAVLLGNVSLNGYAHRVRVVTSPLDIESRWAEFNYASMTAGASGSQFGHAHAESGGAFVPAATEWKMAVSGDAFVGYRPTLLKIDVDGNESLVLQGMTRILRSRELRAVQVEVHPQTAAEIEASMRRCGFGAGVRSDTAAGAAAVMSGADPERVAHNRLYRRTA